MLNNLNQKHQKLDSPFFRAVKEEGDFSLLQDVMGHGKQDHCETCQKHSPSTKSEEILRQITISTGVPKDAPRKMQINLIGEPLYPELNSGEYVLQDKMINMWPFWRHAKSAYVIWYNSVDDRWLISHSKDIGTSKWIFAGPPGSKKWPNEITFKGKVLKQICTIFMQKSKAEEVIDD